MDDADQPGNDRDDADDPGESPTPTPAAVAAAKRADQDDHHAAEQQHDPEDQRQHGDRGTWPDEGSQSGDPVDGSEDVEVPAGVRLDEESGATDGIGGERVAAVR